MVKVTLIAAVSDDGFISRGKGVPWHLPADIAHFRAHTAGKWLLIGRRTFEEMHGWFKPGHKPLILSRDEAFVPELGQRVHSIEEATRIVALTSQHIAVQSPSPTDEISKSENTPWERAGMSAAPDANHELLVCGGGQIYAAAMPRATRLLITRVHTQLGSGVAFPPITESDWRLTHSALHPADDAHEYSFTFLEFQRRTLPC